MDSRTRKALAVLPLALVLSLTAACSRGAGSAAAPSSPTPSSPAVTASAVQQREDEVSGRVALHLTTSASAVTVTRLGLRWAGLAGLPATTPDYPLQQGVPVDLPLALVPPSGCDGAAPDPKTAVADVTVKVSGQPEQRLTVPLAGSAELLQKLWDQGCQRQRVAAAVSLGFAPSWRPVTVAGQPALAGTLVVTRRGAVGPVPVTAVDGSVLLSLAPSRAPSAPGAPLVTLAAGARQAALPVVVGPSRCDLHALGESKKTYVFDVTLAIDGGAAVAVDVSPDPAARPAMWRMLTTACGVR